MKVGDRRRDFIWNEDGERAIRDHVPGKAQDLATLPSLAVLYGTILLLSLQVLNSRMFFCCVGGYHPETRVFCSRSVMIQLSRVDLVPLHHLLLPYASQVPRLDPS